MSLLPEHRDAARGSGADATARTSGLVFLWVYIAGSAAAFVLQRYLCDSFDTFTMGFYRTAAGALPLLAISLMNGRADLLRLLRNRRLLTEIGVVALLQTVIMFLLVEGIRHSSATMCGLIGVLGMPMTAVVACVIFPAERTAARRPGFLVGAILAIVSAVGLTLRQSGSHWTFSAGTVELLLATLLSVATALWARRLVHAGSPWPLAFTQCVATCIALLVATLLWGDVTRVGHVPISVVLWLVGSGVMGTLVGIGAYLVAVRRLGVVVTRCGELALPALTLLFGYLALGETLSLGQAAWGGLLLVGCALSTLGSWNLAHWRFNSRPASCPS